MTNPTVAADPKPGPADLIEIFYEPSAVFVRRREGQFGLPLLGLVVVAAVLYFATAGLMRPVIDAEIGRAMIKVATKPGITPDQVANARDIAEKISPLLIIGAFLIAPFLIGIVTWVVARIAGVRTTLAVGVMLGTFAWFPKLIGMVAGAVEMVLMPESAITSAMSVSFSPARFFDLAREPTTVALLSRLDLFTLWGTFLIGLGLVVTSRATKAQAFGIAISVWLVFGLYAALHGV